MLIGSVIAVTVSWALGRTNALSSSTKQFTLRPIQKVAVIGSGIAGLSVAHALINSPTLGGMQPNLEVSLFDSRPALDFEAGAGIQLNGGMAVLGKINPQLQQVVKEASLAQTFVRSRTKPWNIKEDDTTAATFDTLLEISLKEAIETAGGAIADELIVNGELMWFTIMRGALQEALIKALPAETARRVAFGKTLSNIRPNQAKADGGIYCDFIDGSQSGPYDLVIGCDGIKSAAKEYIDTGRISSDASRREGDAAGIYSGIRIRYAVQDGDPADANPIGTTDLRQYFGDGAYALRGVYGAGKGRPPIKCAFVSFLDEDYIGPFKKKERAQSQTVAENADWTQDVRKTVKDTRQIMLQQVKECGIPEDDVRPIISNADRFFELGVYFHNPFSLNGWSKEVPGSDGSFVVLCGDAAHAMPPFLGQGSNQAIQDAYCLCSKIFEYNALLKGTASPVDAPNNNKSLQQLLKEYEHTRWAPTASISAKACFLGYLETGGEGGLYSKFRDLFFLAMGKIGVAKRVLFDAAIPKV